MTSSRSKPEAEDFSRSHDYPWLIRRWRTAARTAGLAMSSIGTSGGHEVFALRSKSPGSFRLYLSAGIHGDESASTEAILSWVKTNASRLEDFDLTIFPCLNPWGLVHNKRTDADGIDLNRCYLVPDSIPHLSAQASLIAGRRFDLAIILHEDYDARGVYVYETTAKRPFLGESIIAAMGTHLPADVRRRIDDSPAKGGVIRRRVTRDTLPEWPEAFLLHFEHADCTFTIETPSEAAINSRVTAHRAAIDAAISGCKRHLSSRDGRA